MTSSVKSDFDKYASTGKRKRPTPFSIRLSEDERAYLEGKAGNKPLGTYAREKLLGDAQPTLNIGRMIGARFRRKFKVGTKKCCAEFCDKLFARI